MNTIKCFVLLTSLLFTHLAYSQEPSAGSVTCSFDFDGACRIAWDMSQNPRNTYRVERYEPRDSDWKSEQLSIDPYSIADEAAVPARLYRVVGCNSASADCISTSVVWSPLLPESADEIPERVNWDRANAYLKVSKHMPLRYQSIQYNVFLLIQDLDAVDLSSFAPMSLPQSKPSNTIELIHANVYSTYRDMRDRSLGKQLIMHPQRPEAAVIHPAGHPKSHPRDPDHHLEKPNKE